MGFINTVIMARILVPEDYGIVAMAMLIVGLIQTFLDFSATVALLRKKEITKEEINSAWTLRLIQGVLAGVIIAALAPIAVIYFEEPRLLEVLWTFSICVILASASNVAQTLSLRDFDFSIDFKITTIGKLFSVIATIVFGIWLKDYRALTIGIVVGYIVPLILSYTLYPYRPTWNTNKITEIWHVTKWLLLSNIGGFLMRKSDELIAGRLGTTQEFGLYNVGSDLGQLPVSEVGPAMQRAILPVLASIKNQQERTRHAVLKTLSAISTIIWPIGLGFSAISVDVTNLILGSKWVNATPYVAVFAITAAVQSTGGPLRSFLTLLGHTKIQSTITWIEFLLFSIISIMLVQKYHLLGLAYSRLISSILSFLILSTAAQKYCELTWKKILANCYRPILAAIIMYLTIIFMNQVITPGLPRMLASIATGVLFYSVLIISTWHLLKRPEGLESTLIDKIIKQRNK